MAMIKLNSVEKDLIKSIAKQRYESNRGSGVKNAKIGNQSNESTDIDGFGAELIVAKHLNLYPDLSINPRSGGTDLVSKKGKTIDVKQTQYKTGRLLATLKKNSDDNCSDIFVLVIGTFPDYEIIGWCYKEELLKEENILDLGHGKGYALNQDRLRKF